MLLASVSETLLPFSVDIGRARGQSRVANALALQLSVSIFQSHSSRIVHTLVGHFFLESTLQSDERPVRGLIDQSRVIPALLLCETPASSWQSFN